MCSGRGTERGEYKRDVRFVEEVERCAMREDKVDECAGEGRPVDVVLAGRVEVIGQEGW
jgi:hypothetical protein